MGKNKVLLLLILFSVLFSVLLISFEGSQNLYIKKEDQETRDLGNPKMAQTPLEHSKIRPNASSIYRLFESISFTVNTSQYNYTYSTYMQISYPNSSVEEFNMTKLDPDKYYYEYKPRYNAPLGLYNISFLIYNETSTLLNTHTTFTNFTVKTNYMANLNCAEYYIGNTLYGELTVNDFRPHQFMWNLTVVDSVNETSQRNLFNLEKNLVQFSFKIENETFNQVNQLYYIKLNMSDNNSTKVAAAYFPFEVRNSAPKILPSIEFSPAEVLRDEDCTITLNVTDIETKPENLSVTVILETPTGDLLPEEMLEYEGKNNTFTGIIRVPASSPAGKYRVNITALDLNDGKGSFNTFLTVKNNPPEIYGYKINGKSQNESISILYGRDLVFTFNISDVEGIAYIEVALIDENNEWYNITKAYEGEDTEIKIRTAELVTGTWYVYIYVIDTDGEITSLVDDYNLAPQEIRIIPDVLSTYIPWITFFVGLFLGVLAGIGGIYKYYKSKYVAPQAIAPKKKKITPKKSLVKKKEKLKPTIKEIKKKEAEELEPEAEEEKESVPQRKIKRKL